MKKMAHKSQISKLSEKFTQSFSNMVPNCSFKLPANQRPPDEAAWENVFLHIFSSSGNNKCILYLCVVLKCSNEYSFFT